MSQVSPEQVSFNGGEVSQRLRARRDQAVLKIGLAEMTGFAPLVEGAAEAMPGTIHVAEAPGPCRLVRFEYNVTQGHALEFSDELVRIYTNDELLTDGVDPIEVESPYSFAQVGDLSFHQSFDVLYCFHGDLQTREFERTGPNDFDFALLELKNGPFDPRNDVETLTVAADALTGTVHLEASADLFVATDVGGLFKMEAVDFGDIPTWEPYITVAPGQLLTANERVYRVIGGGGAELRTGSLTPTHTEGVEWDGIGSGTDINDKPAAGVQLEYVHDRIGIVKITEFDDEQHVTGEVLRHLPFSAGAGDSSYVWTGGYYDGGWVDWTPPAEAVTYSYGTWRWAFGAFSDTRGWPTGGVIDAERLVLAKGSTLYGSVTADLKNFATLNEFGEQSADMAWTYTLDDANPILSVVSDDKLLALTKGGVWALGPSNAAAGMGSTNIKATRQNKAGAGAAEPVVGDSRTLYIGKSGKRIYQADFDANRGVEAPEDLTRYARQIGKPGFVALAEQRDPHNLLWAVRGDGSLACAAYLPEESVLAWASRPMADGVLARSLCAITDPDGVFEQVWLAVEYGGGWHVLRMAPWREDGESEVTACMVDMGAEYQGDAVTSSSHAVLGAGVTIDVVADGRFQLDVVTGGGGAFALDRAAEHVWAGLRFPAAMESLDLADGGDNGAATGKLGRVVRPWVDVLDARGLKFGTPADRQQEGSMQDLELAQGDSAMDEDFGTFTGLHFRDHAGGHTRTPRLRIERVAPAQATVRAWGCSLQREQR